MSKLHEWSSGRRIHSLLGMGDVDASAWRRRDDALGFLRAHLGASGYEPIDTPLLEETELFVRKAGGDLAGRLYNFTDPGGTPVSLRPEFTASVIRHFIDNEASLSPPLRWQYGGPVFRYDALERGNYRQFTQYGAELVGASGIDADVEIISLAASGLCGLGLDGFRLRIGHLGALHSLLGTFGLSEPVKWFIIGNIQALGCGDADVEGLMAHANDVGLLSGSVVLGLGMETALESMSTDDAEEFILGVLKESMPEPMGRRTTDQIIARLLSKVRVANSPDAFEGALRLASEFSRLSGEPQATLRAARSAAASCGVDAAPLDELELLLDAISDMGAAGSQVVLDLGMARGISYYTGVIFEIVGADGAALGGGGRYDDLVQALGGSGSVPAMGFAYNVNALLDALSVSPVSPVSPIQADAAAVNGVADDDA